jgi:hypothetical protein
VYQEAVSACAVETNGATIDIIIKAVINIAIAVFFIFYSSLVHRSFHKYSRSI